MQKSAASIRKQVEAETAMLDTHASLAKELQAAEAAVKVCQDRFRVSCIPHETGRISSIPAGWHPFNNMC